jgi:UDP-N-acetylglucosamine 2-epimerase (non-hydrolysing)
VVFGELADMPGVNLLEPLSYPDLLESLRRCHFVMSDSGGIQEEAPSFKKPILILRTLTERPEVVESGFGRLVGTDPDVVVAAAGQLLSDPGAYRRMVSGANPFGDGRASERILSIVAERFGLPASEKLAVGA